MSARPNTIEREPVALPGDPCPYCERDVPTRLVRLGWPNPPERDDDYAYMCRTCDSIYRQVVTDFGRTYVKEGRAKLTLRHAPTAAMRRRMIA